MNLVLIKMAMFFLWMTIGCSAIETKSGEPGQCKRSCDKAMIGPSEATFQLVAQSADVLCSNFDQALNNPITVFFRAVEIYKEGDEEKFLPIPNISIDPIINGDMYYDAADATGTDDDRYLGILTPSTDWCTDSCGVVQLSVLPRCPSEKGATNAVGIQLHSGALFSESAIISVATPDDEI